MSCIDFPVARCETVRVMALTDQTQVQCAQEHGCPAGRACPLCGYFMDEQQASPADGARH